MPVEPARGLQVGRRTTGSPCRLILGVVPSVLRRSTFPLYDASAGVAAAARRRRTRHRAGRPVRTPSAAGGRGRRRDSRRAARRARRAGRRLRGSARCETDACLASLRPCRRHRRSACDRTAHRAPARAGRLRTLAVMSTSSMTSGRLRIEDAVAQDAHAAFALGNEDAPVGARRRSRSATSSCSVSDVQTQLDAVGSWSADVGGGDGRWRRRGAAGHARSPSRAAWPSARSRSPCRCRRQRHELD